MTDDLLRLDAEGAPALFALLLVARVPVPRALIAFAHSRMVRPSDGADVRASWDHPLARALACGAIVESTPDGGEPELALVEDHAVAVAARATLRPRVIARAKREFERARDVLYAW